VNTDSACYGGSGRLSVRLLQTPSAVKAFLFVVMGGWWVLAAPASHLLMRWGHKQTSGPSALRKSSMSLSEKCLLIYD
ncbi:hypothetical protein KX491_25130, partial [Escherichia coli]|nr:hypothetical protein [Escherichia coli]